MSTAEAYKTELAKLLAGFGANVRRVRTTGVEPCSQEALAALTALHRTEIGKIEQGIVEPRLTTLMILADALGVGLDELVAGLRVPVERKPSPNARYRDSRLNLERTRGALCNPDIEPSRRSRSEKRSGNCFSGRPLPP